MVPSVIVDLQWMVGNVIMGALAMAIRDWSYLNMAMSIPLLVSLPLVWWLTPESPSWLISQGKLKKAAQVTTKAASWNGRPLTHDQAVRIVDEIAQNTKSQTETKYFQSLKDLFAHPTTRYLCFSV